MVVQDEQSRMKSTHIFVVQVQHHKKLGLKCRSMTWPTGGPPRLTMDKK